LPLWGHLLSQGVLPLLLSHEDRLYPIGTAFTIGSGPTFFVSAAHNIREAFKHEDRLRHILFDDDPPKKIDLKQVGFYLLHKRQREDRTLEFNLWPLETVETATPTDLVLGFPQFQNSFPTIVNRLGFELPVIGETVWSIGYADLHPIDGGFPMEEVKKGTLDLLKIYNHRLTVIEGKVDRIFVRKFMDKYVDGPCFTFDAEIQHGMSGGPILSRDGIVRGINTAGASNFFGRPMSIGSLLHPLLSINARFGVTMGSIRLNATRPLIDLVMEGRILTDGSEERVSVTEDPESGSLVVHPSSPINHGHLIHDDFASFQKGITATKQAGPTYRLRRIQRDDDRQ
jgi:hypothetical protein